MKTKKHTYSSVAEYAYYEYRQYLMQLAMYKTRNRQAAEDLVQDTYLALLSQEKLTLENINKDEFKGYLTLVMHHKFIDSLTDNEEVELSYDIPAESNVREENLEFAHEILNKSVQTLPQRVRKTMMLYMLSYNAEMISTREHEEEETIRARVRKYEPILIDTMKRMAKQYI